MALPVTITGISTAVACVGPFKSSAGNYYFFGRDNTTATTLQAYKATDPTSSWSSITTKTGFATAIVQIAGYQVSDVIHLIVMDGTQTSSVNYKYQTFNMASDSFVTAETITSALAITGQAASGWDCSIVVRSNGNVVAFFNGAQTKKSGTNYARVYYSERTGPSTWTATPVEVDDGNAHDAVFPEAILGASDRVHFIWAYPTGAGVGALERSLSSANALDTAANIDNLGTGAQQGLSYNNAGTIKVVGADIQSAAWQPYYFDSGANPTLHIGSSGAGSAGAARPFNDGTTVYVLYVSSIDGDLWIKSSTDDGANWGSLTDVFNGTITVAEANLSIDGDIYQRGSNVVIPYIVNDNGTLKYNEYIVRSSTTAWQGTAAPTVETSLSAYASQIFATNPASLPAASSLAAYASQVWATNPSALSAASSLVASAQRYTPSLSALLASTALTADSFIIKFIYPAPRQIVTSLTATATRYTPTSAALAAASNLIATANQIWATNTASLSAGASLAADTQRFTLASAALTAETSLVAISQRFTPTVTALAAAFSFFADGTVVHPSGTEWPGASLMTGEASLSAYAAQIFVTNPAALAASLSASVNAQRFLTDSSENLAAVTSLTAVANRYTPTTASISAAAALAAQTTVATTGSAPLTAAANLTARSTMTTTGATALSAGLSVALNAQRYLNDTYENFSAAVSISAAASRFTPTSALLSAAAVLVADANRYTPAVQILSAQAILSISENQVLVGLPSPLQAISSLSIASQMLLSSAVVVSISTTLTATVAQRMSLIVNATATANLAVDTFIRGKIPGTTLFLAAVNMAASTRQLMSSQAIPLSSNVSFSVLESQRLVARTSLPAAATMNIAEVQSLVARISAPATASLSVSSSRYTPTTATLAAGAALSVAGSAYKISSSNLPVAVMLSVLSKQNLAALAGLTAQGALMVSAAQIFSGGTIAINAETNLDVSLLAYLAAASKAGCESFLSINAKVISSLSAIQWITEVDGRANQTQTIQGIAQKGDTIQGIARRTTRT